MYVNRIFALAPDCEISGGSMRNRQNGHMELTDKVGSVWHAHDWKFLEPHFTFAEGGEKLCKNGLVWYLCSSSSYCICIFKAGTETDDVAIDKYLLVQKMRLLVIELEERGLITWDIQRKVTWHWNEEASVSCMSQTHILLSPLSIVQYSPSPSSLVTSKYLLEEQRGVEEVTLPQGTDVELVWISCNKAKKRRRKECRALSFKQ